MFALLVKPWFRPWDLWDVDIITELHGPTWLDTGNCSKPQRPFLSFKLGVIRERAKGKKKTKSKSSSVGWTSRVHLAHPSVQSRTNFQVKFSLKVSSGGSALSTSKDGDFTASLGSLFQCCLVRAQSGSHSPHHNNIWLYFLNCFFDAKCVLARGMQ